MNLRFYQLALGAPFFFRGRRYVKIAMGMATDETGQGFAFIPPTDVTPDGEPQLLPPEVAYKWSWPHWDAERMDEKLQAIREAESRRKE